MYPSVEHIQYTDPRQEYLILTGKIVSRLNYTQNQLICIRPDKPFMLYIIICHVGVFLVDLDPGTVDN